MRRIVSVLLICCLTFMIFSSFLFLNTANEVSAAENGMQEIINFESMIAANDGKFPVKNGYAYDAETGVLTAPGSDATIFLPGVVDASYYTIHVEMAVQEVVTSKVIGNALLIGTADSHYRFYVKDVTRDTAANRPAYARLDRYVSGTQTTVINHQTCDNLLFNANVWFGVDITIDRINGRVDMYVNGNREITTSALKDQDVFGQIGFFAKKAMFRNLSVSVRSEHYSFDSLETSGNINLTYGNAGDAAYGSGILTMTSNSNRSVLLNDADVSALKKFTLHTEMKIPEYGLSTVFESGIGVGNSTGSLYRFVLKDDGKERNNESIRTAYIAQIAGSNTIGTTSLDFNMIPNTWISFDVLIDTTQENNNVDVYVNDRFVATYTLTAAQLSAAKVGFRGFNGVAFRNFKVLDGLVVPVAEGFTSAQLMLNEKIDVIFTARIPESAANLTAEILFDGKVISFDASDLTVNVDTAGYKNVIVTLKDICPQDVCDEITVQLYASGKLIAQKENYSVQSYCLNILPNRTYAGSDEERVELRQMLLAILNYGTFAQKFFTADTVFANDGIAQSDFVHADISSANSIKDISAKQNDDFYWRSATLALYNTVCMRFKFVATDLDRIVIKAVVDGATVQIYTTDDYVVLDEKSNLYYVDFGKMLANQFDEAVVMELWVDGSLLQSVTYSVNSYIHAYSASGKTESDSSYNLVQAIYDYGCIAQTYGG